MLKIGMFSKISQVSVKTLRYYDEIGLLRPVQTDSFTSYRYYSPDQLTLVHRIMAMKDLGLALDQIIQVIREGVTTEQLYGMLRLKRAELQSRLEADQEMLKRVEVRLNQIEQEDTMSDYEVVIKQEHPVAIASLRGIIPSYPEQDRLWMELGEYMSRQQPQPMSACFTLYHTDEPEIDAEVCWPLQTVIPGSERIKSYVLDGSTVASTVHHGPFVTIGQAYQALLKWIDANGYQISGPGKEIYLNVAKAGSQTDPDTVTEVQYPVMAKG